MKNVLSRCSCYPVLLLFFLAGCAENKAPTAETAAAAVKKLMPVEGKVVQVSKVKGIPGLYEAVMMAGNQALVYYIDSKGEYVISGSIIAVDTKQNLTAETEKKFKPK